MIRNDQSDIRKKLAVQFILQHAEYRQLCRNLMDIISISRQDDFWRMLLLESLELPLNLDGIGKPARN
ncbi:MAG: hypothetical protein ACO25B_02035 [Chitinophagaceae bacterium]